MKRKEFESGLMEYVRKELEVYGCVDTICYSKGTEKTFLIIHTSFGDVTCFGVANFMNTNFSFAGAMKYPRCLDMIEKDYDIARILYKDMFSIIKKEFDEKMNKVYIDYYNEESNNNALYQQELELSRLKSELTKYKFLYQNTQSQLQTIKSIINKIEE